MSRFVILSPGFAADESDTTCLPAFQQFALSVKKLYPEHEFILISFQYPFVKKEYYWNGLKVIALGGANKAKLCRLFTWIKAYRYLKNLHKHTKIEGILSLWLSECSLVGKYFAKKNKIKHFMWLIGQDAKKSNQYIKRIKPEAKEIIAMSDFLQQEFFENHGVRPFMVAENGINESAFPRFNEGERPTDILGVGSLTSLKNYPLFIEIIAELKKKYAGLKVVLAGAGEEEANLKSLTRERSLDVAISFTGRLSHAEVFDLMSQSKIFLHTSKYEGNSTVLMEALYSGCFTFSTCPLSSCETPNLTILKNKEDFVKAMAAPLDKKSKAERITFNTMDATAKKIMNLFLH